MSNLATYKNEYTSQRLAFSDEEVSFAKRGNESEQMKQLRLMYHNAQQEDLEENAAYLFVIGGFDQAPTIQGDMPRGKAVGYIFDNSTNFNDGRLVAHELGHGLFALEHTFATGYGVPQGSTNNLMDYVNNDFLASWQWKIINNPGFVWNFLEGDEDAMAKKLTGTYIVYVGDSIMTDKRIFINTNKQSKLYLKYTPMVSDTVTTINAKVVYCPEWSDKNIFWPTENSWGKLNVNTKTSFPLDSLPEGKYMVLIRDKNQNVDTLKFYLWNKKYDFACSVCGRNLALTLSKLQQIFPDNKNLIQQYVDYLNDALKKGGFTTCKRHAHFFSQVAIESADFIEFTESYYYRLTRIYEVFGNQSNDSYKTLYSQNFWDDNQHLEYISTNNCEHRYEKKKNYSDISNKNERYVGISSVTKTRNGYTITFPRSFDNDTTGIYKRYTIPNLRQNGENLFNLVYKDRNGNTQSGDGWKYRGRGAIQVTGRSNYKATSNKCNAVFEKNFDWENNPDQLETDFESIIYSAVAWFLNAFNPISILDNKTSNQVTGTVNTKREKQAERANKYNNLINNFQLYDCETK